MTFVETRTQDTKTGKSGAFNEFFHSTKDDVLTSDASKGAHNVEWSMDASFGVHADFTSHVRGTITFKDGKGSPIDILAKLKLNTES